MSLETLRLTLTTPTYPLEYDITVVQDTNNSQTKDAFSIAPPGSGPSENIFLGVSGMGKETEIRWAIHDDGTDKSNGTLATAIANNDLTDRQSNAVSKYISGDTVVTLAEQVHYLEDIIHVETFTAEWELDHVTGGMYVNEPVYVEEINTPTILNDSPKWLEARMRLRFGSSTV